MTDDLFEPTTENDRMNELVHLLNIGCWTAFEAKHILMGIAPDSDVWDASPYYSFLPGETFLRENRDPESRRRHCEMELDYMSGFICGSGKQPEVWIDTARRFRFAIPWVPILADDQAQLARLPKEVQDAVNQIASKDACEKTLNNNSRPPKRKNWVSEHVKRMMATDLEDSQYAEFTDEEFDRFLSGAIAAYRCEHAPIARAQYDVEKHGPIKDLKVRDERTIEKFAKAVFADAKAQT